MRGGTSSFLRRDGDRLSYARAVDIGILILLGVLATFAAGLGAYRTLDAAVGRRAANSLLLLALAVVLALTTIAPIFAAVERPSDGL